MDAKLNSPQGVAVDGADNLYIADYLNFRIRRVDTATWKISTIAGDGTQGYSGDGGPAASARLGTLQGIKVDSAGNIYFVDYYVYNHNTGIRRIDASTGTITTIAGRSASGYGGDGGAPTSATLQKPTGLAIGPSRELYIADQENHRVRWMPLD
jgi:sugar lactone lactonase YvrE